MQRSVRRFLPGCLPASRFHAGLTRAVRLGLGLAAVAVAPAVVAQTPATNQAPAIVTQPANRVVYLGQTATFAVEATGNPAPAYQWWYNGSPLSGATNQLLVLTNVVLEQAGFYAAIVTNVAGSTNSNAATLTVLPTPLPGLSFGNYGPGSADTNAPAAASIPVRFTSSGQETNLSFSITFNTNTLANPRFAPNLIRTLCACSQMAQFVSTVVYVPAATNGPGSAPLPPFGEPTPGRTGRAAARQALPEDTQLTEDRSQEAAGFYGVKLVLPAGQVFETGDQILGAVEFDRVAGSAKFAAGLSFTTNPVPVAAGRTNGNAAQLGVLAPPPVFTLTETNAVLDRQSGLLLQRVSLANPGFAVLTNARVTVQGLTNDTLGIPIRIRNAPTVGTDLTTAQIFVPELQPAEDRVLTLEFYVADLKTQPAVTFTTDSVAPLPPPVLSNKRITITKTQYFTSEAYPSGAFLVEWVTAADRRYVIQYAPTLAGLDDPAVVRTVNTLQPGTGSRVQWIDSGPPKTISPPGADSRFYRILETQ